MTTTARSNVTPSPRPRGRGRPNRISREQIIGAMLDMLSEEGLESFSMARLSARMNASPMALYTYFSGREALLDATTATILGQFQVPADPADWRTAIRDWIHALDTLFHRWPVLLKLIKREEHLSPAWLKLWVPMMRVLRDAGLEGERLAFASSWLANTAMSLMASQFRSLSGAEIEILVEAAPAEDRALVGDVLAHALPDRRRAVFEHGVDTMVDALERMIEREAVPE